MPRWRWYGWGSSLPRPGPMNEDECQEMLQTASEAHTDLNEPALRLLRRLSSAAPATKATVKAEQELFRLRRELQRIKLSCPYSAERRGPG